MELSIVIPVYNAEEYLKDCVESVLKCPIEEMECILVNDGSTDQSAQICDEYRKADRRIKVVNQKNTGVSSARNNGIGVAQGRYIMFLDADDYMDVEGWKQIQRHISQKLYEFVAYSYYTLYESGRIERQTFSIEQAETEQYSIVQELILASSKLNMCWGKLYLAEVIKREQLKFRKDIKIGEDYIFVSEYLQKVKKCLLSNACILYYRQHKKSAMHKYDVDTRLGYLQLLYEYNKACVERAHSDELSNKMYIYYLRMITNLCLEFSKYNEGEELRVILDKIVTQPFVKEILSRVKRAYLPSKMKGLEYQLLKKRKVVLLSNYFRLKMHLAKQ